jgi:hypothetical protein
MKGFRARAVYMCAFFHPRQLFRAVIAPMHAGCFIFLFLFLLERLTVVIRVGYSAVKADPLVAFETLLLLSVLLNDKRAITFLSRTRNVASSLADSSVS